MSIVYKQPVTFEQQKEQLQAQESKAALDAIKKSIADETLARQNDDVNLNLRIDALTENLASETAIRNSAVTQMQADLLTERNQRTNADSNLENRINTEISNRESADDNLRDEFTGALDAEKVARAQAIQDMKAAILVSMGDDKAAEAIENEKLREQIEEAAASQSANLSALATRLTAEETNRAAEDTAIRAEIAAEILARQNADSQLQNSLSADIRKEISDRENAISGVEGLISDTKLELTAEIEREILNRRTAVSAAKKTFSDALDEEVLNRNLAIESATNISKSYVDAQIASVEENLNDFTAPTATTDGKRGLVPATAAGTDMKILTNYGWRSAGDTTLTISTVPSQVGTLTFNGNTQTPTWLNFDNKKLKVEGTTSASDAGVFTVTFTPLDIYLWADSLDQTPKTATWKIDAMKLAKPTAAIKTFTYSGVAQGLTVSNFDSVYESQTGTISAANVGNYSAVYELKNKNNTHWSDDSTADVVISWSISHLKLNKPNAAVISFTYDSTTKTLQVADFDSNYESQTGTTSAVNVNSYSATYKLKDTANTRWADDSTADVVINWKIEPLKLTKPTAAVTEFDGDGTTKTLTVANYNSTYENRTGTVSAKDSGTYTVTYSLKNTTNTKWADGTTANVVITWKINLRVLSAAQSSGFEQVGTLTYTGNSQTVSIKNYDENYHELSSTTSAVNAGTYTAKITPKAGCVWNDNTRTAKSVSWSIAPQAVTIPTAATLSFTYDGNVKNLSPSNVDSTKMNQTGTVSATAAGDYQVNFALKSKTNYVWQGNSTDDVIIYWAINKKIIAKPTCATTTFTYSGDEKTVVISNVDLNSMTESGTKSETNAGNYSVTYALKDTTNTSWQGGTVANVVISWKIERKKLTAAQSSGFEQVGELFFEKWLTQGPTIKNYDATVHEMHGKTSSVYPGTFEARISPIANHCWNDGTTTSKTVSWTIQKRKLTKPVISDRNVFFTTPGTDYATKFFVYDGTAKTILYDNYDADCMAKSGTETATDANPENQGSYQLTFSLLKVWSGFGDVDAYMWEDGSTDDVVLDWYICTQKMPIENSYPVICQTVSLPYTGGSQSVYTACPALNTTYHAPVTTSGDAINATTPGTYTAHFKPAKNYSWHDWTNGQIEIVWIISARAVATPIVAQTDFEYDGQTHSLDISNFDSSYVNRTGTVSASAIGNYSVTFSLKDKTNTAWATGGTADIVVEWTVGLSKVAAPVMTSSIFTYDGNTKTPTFEGITAAMSQSGDTSAVNAGSYRVTFSLNDKNTNVWEDGTNSDKVYVWKVNRKPLTAAQSTFSQSGTLNYSASTQVVTISGYDANYHSLGGTYSAVNANSYTAQISPLPNYCFNDGSVNPVAVDWVINPLKLVKPSVAVTDFVYDKNSHEISISNFNSTYENQTGTTSETAAGVYGVTFLLKSTTNTTWADGTVGEVIIPWSITKRTFAKPTAYCTNFTFAFAYHTLSISGYDSNYMTQEGTISERNAGDYQVTYSLIDKTLYQWADSTTDDVVINWKINPGKLISEQSNPYQKVDLTYTGNAISINNATNLNGYSAYQVWTGDFSATDAGEYTAYVAPDSNHTFDDGTTAKRAVKWTIDRAQIAAPALDSSVTLTYNENEQSPTLTGFDAAKMTLSSDTSKIDAGDYVLQVTPNSNYCWQDNSVDAVNLNWEIKPVVKFAKFSLRLKTNPSVSTPGFTGEPLEMAIYHLSTANSPYDSDSDLFEASGDWAATNVGAYYATLTFKNPNYVWGNKSRSYSVGWQVLIRNLTPPAMTETNIVYDGNEHAAPTSSSNYVTVSGDLTATAVGNYQTVYTLKYPEGTRWRFGTSGNYTYSTEPVILNWSIGMTQITAPTFGTDYFDYDGNAHTLTISGFDSSTMTKSGTESASDKGFYTVTISLKNKDTTCWSTGGNADIVIEWAVGKKRIDMPALADDAETTFTYDGTAKTLNITGYDSNTTTRTGTVSATDAGEYSVRFATKSTTACTYVRPNGQSGNVTFNWTIEKAALPEVTFKQTNLPYYNGEAQSPVINNFDAATMDLSSTTSAVNAGTYTLQISPKANYCWADGTSTAKSVNWAIPKRFVNKITAKKTVYEYTGAEVSLSYTSNSPNQIAKYVNVGGVVSATASGSYTATFSLKDTVNTYWSDKTTAPISINWSIGAAYLEVPTVSPETQTSQGLNAVHSVTVSGFDANTMTQSGTISTDTGAAATYTVTFALKDKTSTQWADGTTTDKNVTWTVERKVLTQAESTFAQDTAVAYESDTGTRSITEVCSAIKAEYLNQFYTCDKETFPKKKIPGTSTVTMTPTAAACWNDKSTTAKTFTLTVDKAQLPRPFPYFYSRTVYVKATSASVFNFTEDNYLPDEVDITATSSNPNVIAIHHVYRSTGVYVNILDVGRATITVNFSSNYYEVPASKSFEVVASLSLHQLDWSQIAAHIKDGTFANHYSVGDYKNFNVNGTVGTLAINGEYRAVLIGIDHNAGIEGDKRAHFAIMQAGAKNIAFVDQFYGTHTDNNQAFTIATNYDNGVRETYSQYLLRTRCSEFFNALPAELQAVITTCKKPYRKDGGVGYVNDKVWLLSPYEVFGSTQNSRMCSYYEVYEYFANGNSKVCYRHDDTNTAVEWYLRDGDYYDGGNALLEDVVYVSTSGAYADNINKNVSRGIVPCFTIS